MKFIKKKFKLTKDNLCSENKNFIWKCCGFDVLKLLIQVIKSMDIVTYDSISHNF